ncbi:hypothetical protein [Pseudooceanicola onchidii]|uniref:hypothetical protein n=1 Tax=Pseudooceanicola onchidii TaxID=2562279 RepID=UPI0010AAE092|nr:hypothetical protein [Pseudooceanicola onchidii]
MSDKPDTRPTPIGVYGGAATGRLTSLEVVALAVSAIWVLGSLIFWMTLGSEDAAPIDPLTRAMVLLAVVLPLAMFWVAVLAVRTGRQIREESRRMQATVDAIRESYQSGIALEAGLGGADTITRKLDEIAAAQLKTETALATFQSTRKAETPKKEEPTAPPKVQVAEEQADLPLEVVGDAEVTLPKSTLIRALNFPETAEDEDGFAALRTALRDRVTANLVQASQDVLTLLSQDGIYMDALRPDMARPELWRRFAQGERGRQVAALGGIRDRSSLALTAGRMRQDPIFRDAAHHFLRRFDSMLQQFEGSATDQEISALAETRTARAFMLLGRVAGVFT